MPRADHSPHDCLAIDFLRPVERPGAPLTLHYRACGTRAQLVNGWIGDWWAYGEHNYGDRKALEISDVREGQELRGATSGRELAQ